MKDKYYELFTSLKGCNKINTKMNLLTVRKYYMTVTNTHSPFELFLSLLSIPRSYLLFANFLNCYIRRDGIHELVGMESGVGNHRNIYTGVNSIVMSDLSGESTNPTKGLPWVRQAILNSDTYSNLKVL